jgi:hypothetical protein
VSVPSSEWDPPSLSRKRVCVPPRKQSGGGHTRLRVGGDPDLDDWRKSLALYNVYSVPCPVVRGSLVNAEPAAKVRTCTDVDASWLINNIASVLFKSKS